jgi:hypothetical protein
MWRDHKSPVQSRRNLPDHTPKGQRLSFIRARHLGGFHRALLVGPHEPYGHELTTLTYPHFIPSHLIGAMRRNTGLLLKKQARRFL